MKFLITILLLCPTAVFAQITPPATTTITLNKLTLFATIPTGETFVGMIFSTDGTRTFMVTNKSIYEITK